MFSLEEAELMRDGRGEVMENFRRRILNGMRSTGSSFDWAQNCGWKAKGERNLEDIMVWCTSKRIVTGLHGLQDNAEAMVIV